MVILPSPIRCTFILLQMVPPLKRHFEDTLALPVIEQRKIRFILVTDYTTVIAYDRTVKDQTTFDYSDFKTNYEFFLPLTGLCEKAIAYSEHPADTKACEKMGRLYDHIQIINRYENHDEKHTLNVFLTRLLFCFFAEDTGIFPEQNQMVKALKSVTQKTVPMLPSFLRSYLRFLTCRVMHLNVLRFPPRFSPSRM